MCSALEPRKGESNQDCNRKSGRLQRHPDGCAHALEGFRRPGPRAGCPLESGSRRPNQGPHHPGWGYSGAPAGDEHCGAGLHEKVLRFFGIYSLESQCGSRPQDRDLALSLPSSSPSTPFPYTRSCRSISLKCDNHPPKKTMVKSMSPPAPATATSMRAAHCIASR